MWRNARVVSIGALVETALDGLRPTAQAKNISIGLALSERPAFVEGDPERLRQVATNLLSNALKFTPTGGRVDVRVRRTADEVEVYGV